MDQLVTALGAKIYYSQGKTKVIPEDSPVPVMSIESCWDKTWILWYSKETGWISDGRSVIGPKEFILDCVENKIDMFEAETEEWWEDYK